MRTNYRRGIFRSLMFESLDTRNLMAGDTFSGTGLLAQYYNNADLTDLALVRVDAGVQFDWANSSPSGLIGADSFSARWSGQVEAQFTERHTFHVSADDGVRLWVNGRLLVDRWSDAPVSNATGSIDLVSGRKNDIVLEYYENTGNASLSLEWSSPSQARAIVPTVRLFPSERGSLLREIWSSVSGNSISDLTGLNSFPHNPSSVTNTTSFETSSNSDNFGERIRGFLVPPKTGEYIFFVAANESAEFWLSNSSDSAGKQLLAIVPSPTDARQWNKFPQQQSSVVNLVAGQSYYVEALHKEATGNDHFSVGWTLPGHSDISVISGEYLTPILPEVRIFAEHPTTAEGAFDTAKLSVVRSGAPLTNPLTVSYVLRGSASNGVDYVSLPGTVMIPAGQNSATISITASEDLINEGPENIIVELSENAGYQTGGISERTATATIQDNVSAPAGGSSLLAGTALSSFSHFGGSFTTVSDATFGSVIQAAITNQQANAWDSQLRQNVSGPVNVGDILYAEFLVRSITPSGNISAIFERNVSPFTKSLSHGLSLNTGWSKVQLRFLAAESYAAGQASFGFHLGSQIQTLQFANFKLVNYGVSSNLSPSTGLVLNNIGGTYGTMQTVSVTGQIFHEANQINTNTVPANSDTWRLQAVEASAAPVQAADNLRVEFWARSVSGSSPRIGVALQEGFGNFTTLSYHQINTTSNWQKYSFDTATSRAYSTKQLQLAFNVGFAIQSVQIADVKWSNITRGVNFDALPERFPTATYVGRSGTASWRSDAEARIAQNRMAEFKVQVKDTQGTPIDGAVVRLEQQKQNFKFGTAVSGYGSLLTTGGGPEALKYQSEIRRLFNTAVIENNLKWPDFQNNRQLGIDAANWVVNNGLYLRGHNVIWPSREYMPKAVWDQYDLLVSSQGTAAASDYLRNTINTRVADAANALEGIAGEWDIVNEPYGNNDAMSVLGNDELLQWFRLFRNNDPTAKRTLNDYDIFSRNGNNADHRANFDYWLGRLVDQNLIEIIGEQSHYNDASLTDIDVLGQLIQSYYAVYSRPIAITEFDVNSMNEQLQADYLRDYMTMVFSQPGTTEFVQWGFWSKSHWLPSAALYRDDFSIKPNGQAYEDLVFGDWWSQPYGTTYQGQYQSRVFLGDYRVVVEIGGQEVVVNATLGSSGATLLVEIPNLHVPTSISLNNRSIAENMPINSLVGSLSTFDADVADTFTYALVGGQGGTHNELFQIQGNQLKSKTAFDFETQTAYSIRIRSTDQTGLSSEMSWTIQVENLLESDGMRSDLVVPLYQFPSFTDGSRTQLSGWWGEIVATASAEQPITVIINPSSGPMDPGSTATAVDYQIYVDAMRLLRSNAFIQILGYIPTGYTSRALSHITQFVDWYASGYKDLLGGSLLDGIFLDEYLGDSESISYYREIRDGIRSRDRLANDFLMANPGVAMPSSTHFTEPIADAFIVYENVESPTGPGAISLASSSVPTNAATGTEFGAIVHSIPSLTEMRRIVKIAKSKGYAFVFVTDDIMPNPFDVSPSFWSNVFSELHRPVILDQSFSVAETVLTNSAVGDLMAFDPDPKQSLTYSIVSGNPEGTFAIDSQGILRLSTNLNYETRPSYALTIQISDNGVPAKSETASVTVAVTNVNEAPSLTVTTTNVVGNVLSSVSNSGTWLDPENDVTALSASLGTVTKNSDGTWNWSYTPTTKLLQQLVTITGTDSGGAASTVTFQLNANVAVTNSKVYYKGSSFSNSGNDIPSALDSSKSLAVPASTPKALNFSNVVNTSRGINGLVFDVAGLVASSLANSDFLIRMSPTGAFNDASNPPSSWSEATAPSLISVTPGNATIASRIRLEWPDFAIVNRWLQIVIKANSSTGLASPAVFYLGSAVGEINGVAPYRVLNADMLLVQAAIGAGTVPITDARDVNKDKRITNADMLFLQARVTPTPILNDITIPPAGSAAEGAGG